MAKGLIYEFKQFKEKRIFAIQLSGSIKRRLSDMGMTLGATVKMLRLAPLGDPVEFRVLNCNIGIRKKDAEKIFIHKVVK